MKAQSCRVHDMILLSRTAVPAADNCESQSRPPSRHRFHARLQPSAGAFPIWELACAKVQFTSNAGHVQLAKPLQGEADGHE